MDNSGDSLPLLEPLFLDEPAWELGNPDALLHKMQLALWARIIKHHNDADDDTLGRKKMEKLLYMIESHIGLELGRKAQQKEYGPYDGKNFEIITSLALKQRVFREVKKPGNRRGYYFEPLENFEQAVSSFEELFLNYIEIDKLIRSFLEMKSYQAEIVATLYAAWNNLLLRGEQVDQELLFDEFYKWSEHKRDFERTDLLYLKAWMINERLVPTGQANLVLPPDGWTVPTKQEVVSSPIFTNEQAALYKQLQALLDERTVITSKDVQEFLDIDAPTTHLLLEQLLKEGLVREEKGWEGLRYRQI